MTNDWGDEDYIPDFNFDDLDIDNMDMDLDGVEGLEDFDGPNDLDDFNFDDVVRNSTTYNDDQQIDTGVLPSIEHPGGSGQGSSMPYYHEEQVRDNPSVGPSAQAETRRLTRSTANAQAVPSYRLTPHRWRSIESLTRDLEEARSRGAQRKEIHKLQTRIHYARKHQRRVTGGSATATRLEPQLTSEASARREYAAKYNHVTKGILYLKNMTWIEWEDLPARERRALRAELYALYPNRDWPIRETKRSRGPHDTARIGGSTRNSGGAGAPKIVERHSSRVNQPQHQNQEGPSIPRENPNIDPTLLQLDAQNRVVSQVERTSRLGTAVTAKGKEIARPQQAPSVSPAQDINRPLAPRVSPASATGNIPADRAQSRSRTLRAESDDGRNDFSLYESPSPPRPSIEHPARSTPVQGGRELTSKSPSVGATPRSQNSGAGSSSKGFSPKSKTGTPGSQNSEANSSWKGLSPSPAYSGRGTTPMSIDRGSTPRSQSSEAGSSWKGLSPYPANSGRGTTPVSVSQEASPRSQGSEAGSSWKGLSSSPSLTSSQTRTEQPKYKGVKELRRVAAGVNTQTKHGSAGWSVTGLRAAAKTQEKTKQAPTYGIHRNEKAVKTTVGKLPEVKSSRSRLPSVKASAVPIDKQVRKPAEDNKKVSEEKARAKEARIEAKEKEDKNKLEEKNKDRKKMIEDEEKKRKEAAKLADATRKTKEKEDKKKASAKEKEDKKKASQKEKEDKKRASQKEREDKKKALDKEKQHKRMLDEQAKRLKQDAKIKEASQKMKQKDDKARAEEQKKRSKKVMDAYVKKAKEAKKASKPSGGTTQVKKATTNQVPANVPKRKCNVL